MLNAMIATARKDLTLMARDPAALAILFIMPLVFILVMSLAMARVSQPSAKPIDLAVADEDQGAFAAELIRQLKTAGGLEIVSNWQGKPLDRTAAERLIVARRQQAAIVIPAGSSEALAAMVTRATATPLEITLLTDPSLSPQVLSPLRAALTGLAQQAAFRSISSAGIDRMVEQLTARGGSVPQDFIHDLKTRAKETQNGTSQLIAVRETTPGGMAVQRRPNSVEQNVPAYTLFGLFFVALQLSANLLEEKRLGTFRRLLAAPVPRWTLMAGKLLAFGTINLAQVAVLFTVGVLALPLLGAPGMSLGEHPEGLLVVTLALSLTANTLGLLLAARARTPGQSTGLGLIIVLTSAMIGGVMVPRPVMPPLMQTLGLVSPHTWGLMAYQDVLIRGASVTDIVPAITALLGFAAMFFAIAAWRFRWD